MIANMKEGTLECFRLRFGEPRTSVRADSQIRMEDEHKSETEPALWVRIDLNLGFGGMPKPSHIERRHVFATSCQRSAWPWHPKISRCRQTNFCSDDWLGRSWGGAGNKKMTTRTHLRGALYKLIRGELNVLML